MANIFFEYLKLACGLFMDFMPHKDSIKSGKLRSRCLNKTLYVEIHEWGGYNLVREKQIHRIKSFTCGLQFQLERFNKYKGNYDLFLVVSMSDAARYKELTYVKEKCDLFIETSNLGKDFSGYASFYNLIKNKPNSYVLLTNSSVSDLGINCFIDEYIGYMETHMDVGMLGISYNSRCYQSLKKNNFTPHLQSFFLLTTIEVLNQVVELNRGFPGAKIANKSLLIREGEVKMSQLVLKLGYQLAVVTNNGIVKFDNNRGNWKLKIGDSRIGSLYPNAIVPIRSREA